MVDRFDKFTERARRVLTFAQEEAKRLGAAKIDSEHILLGLIKEGGGLSIRVMQNLGVDPELLKGRIEALTQSRSDLKQELFLSGIAKKIIELAVDEAKRMSHSYIGTEHLLIGILRVDDGTATVLKEFGVDLEKARSETKKILGQGPVAVKNDFIEFLENLDYQLFQMQRQVTEVLVRERLRASEATEKKE